MNIPKTAEQQKNHLNTALKSLKDKKISAFLEKQNAHARFRQGLVSLMTNNSSNTSKIQAMITKNSSALTASNSLSILRPQKLQNEYEQLLLRRSYVGHAGLLAENHKQLVQAEINERKKKDKMKAENRYKNKGKQTNQPLFQQGCSMISSCKHSFQSAVPPSTKSISSQAPLIRHFRKPSVLLSPIYNEYQN